jgi:hypothetical protein
MDDGPHVLSEVERSRSMALTASHAAEHNRYEVHELLGGEPALDLGRRFETSDFGAAVDFAFDYLERRDPRREGIVGALEIVRVAGSARETVWSYVHAPTPIRPGDMTRVWGYDVTRSWSSPYRTPARPTPARNY